MMRYLGIALASAMAMTVPLPWRAAHDGVMLTAVSMTPHGLDGLIPWIAAAALSGGLGLLLRKWLS